MLGESTFSVVDVETTGLFPKGRDRIVEIAVVRLGPTGELEDEFVTLVNPERDVGPTRIHGITAQDIVNAPKFREIAGDVASVLASAVVVSHNARFDNEFIEAELGRIVERHPPLAMLCSLRLAQRIAHDAPAYNLGVLCEFFGLPRIEKAHTAREDARAAALVFGVLLRRAEQAGLNSLTELGCSCDPAPADAWPPLPRGGTLLTRQRARARSEPSYLARLVSKLQSDALHREAETIEYAALLDRVLEDRIVTEAEMIDLFHTATRWGLSRERVLGIHHSYLEALVGVALADGSVSLVEREDLELVTRIFGCDASFLDAMLDSPSGSETQSQRPTMESLQGLSVCFTGDSRLNYRGEHLTREVAEDLAGSAGLVVKKGVSKGLDLLVVVDAHSLSGKAEKARRYGTRVIAENVFWNVLDIPME
ncbi:MAG: exonuclease domain-containing protein [Dehalococcoidia bacterium]